MFNNELMADVHFIVGPSGESRRLPAHKVNPAPVLDLLWFDVYGSSACDGVKSGRRHQ